MKLYADEFYAFALGAAISWVATYRALTKDRRLVAAVRSNINLLSDFNGLSKNQYRKTLPPLTGSAEVLVSDERIRTAYNAVTRSQQHKLVSKDFKRLNPAMLTAETIICEELLGLTYTHAVRALLRINSLGDLPEVLQQVAAEIAAEETKNSN
jgi:hypothetical protein